MIQCKRTLYFPFPQGTTPHLHIILTDPVGNPPVVVLVNISTYHGKSFEDSSVILTPGQHPYIQRDSYVAYDYAKKVNVEVMQSLIDRGHATFRDDVDGHIFELIRSGLLKSRRTPVELKTFCRRLWS
jgi:hypothetical protein